MNGGFRASTAAANLTEVHHEPEPTAPDVFPYVPSTQRGLDYLSPHMDVWSSQDAASRIL
ncbi:hypothetical protein ColTof4_14066 [Colletotrichum tofieldiae]|nr:hypothetical protein ColTof3_14702 [Colletotrichum tofieldiae]GKT81643.1 hypothetical protein ColTof4_14066 [Colletotrichum tofieldiae]GKT97618.1 hypothetical protein Ct61P_15468 [Colletotrichum tofieldiae]